MSKARKIKITKSQLPTLRSLTAYASVFAVFVSAVGYSYQLPNGIVKTPVNAAQQESSVDEATALLVAGNMAMQANLPIAADIANRSTSLFIQNMISRDGVAVIAKPQVGNPTADEHSIIDYVVKDGDTPQSVADKFKVSIQTIKWANNLSSDTLEVDAKLVIPPVDGVVYVAKEGDTVESIADKYKSDAQQITTLNDLELSGIKSGQRLILPNGELPEKERPGYVVPLEEITTIASAPAATAAPASSTSPLVNGYSPIAMVASGNAYAFGNCTSWAYERRVQLGHPVGSYWGNGATWDSSARAAGYIVDKNPTVGSVFQMPAFVDEYTGVYGHVGIVEGVNPDGSIYISEMNYAGNFNVVTYRTIPAAQVALYNYIH